MHFGATAIYLAAQQMSKISVHQHELLSRVKAICAPLEGALSQARHDDDGDEPAPPIDRDIVATAYRRLRALADDIASGLYDPEGTKNGD